MRHTSSAPDTAIALEELRSAEWFRLTFGLFWRTALWSILSSIVGTAVMYAVAHATTTTMGPTADPTWYFRVSVASTVVLSLGVMLLMFRWYAQWILAARYGSLRLAVVRSGDADRPTAAT